MRVEKTMWKFQQKAFSLVELLVVITIIAILAAILLSALARTKQTASRALCTSNQKQLSIAYQTFAGNHGDKIPYASAWHMEPVSRWAWVEDSMGTTWGGSEASTVDWLRRSPLMPYLGRSTGVFKCPEDKSLLKILHPVKTNVVMRTEPRGRSYSINIFMGGWSGHPFREDVKWTTYRKISEIDNPGARFTFIEMPSDYINAGNYRVVMGDEGFWMDYPGIYHNFGTSIAFIDGHVEFRRWLDARTKAPEQGPQKRKLRPSMGNKDVRWLQARTTTPDPNFKARHYHNWFAGTAMDVRESMFRQFVEPPADAVPIVGLKGTYAPWGYWWNSGW